MIVLGPSHFITGGRLDSEDEGRIGDIKPDKLRFRL